MRAIKQPLLFVSLLLLGVSALLSWDNAVRAIYLLKYFGQISADLYVLLTLDIVSRFVVVFVALAAVVWGLASSNARSAKWIVFFVGLFGPLVSLGIGVYWMTQGSNFVNAFFPAESVWAMVGDIAVWFELLAVILFSIGLLVHKTSAAPQPETRQPRFDPMTGQPIAVSSAPSATPVNVGALSNLPTIALVLAFFVPLAAVIVGHISLNQMKQGLISSVNQSTAKAATILGYVFVGLGFIFGIIFAVVYGILLSNIYR